MNARLEPVGQSYWERNVGSYTLALHVLGRPWPRILELTGRELGSDQRVLEVACGTGVVTRHIAPLVRELEATDYASGMLRRAQARTRAAGLRNVRFQQADLHALPFAPRSFDAVIAANVLHLIPDLERALAALRSMLKPGGLLIAPTFCHAETALARVVSYALERTGFPARRRFTAATLAAGVRSAGLRLEASESVAGPIPIGFVSGRQP